MNFNVRQKKVINATEPNIVCLAAAGVGKTSCLTERIKTIIQNGCSPDKIVAITFTSMAAEEMRKRLGDIAEGAFIGTIHSYANAICIANGISTEKYVADAEFDKIIEKVLTIPTKRYFPVSHLLIDEFQDTGSLEYRFIERIPTENRFYIGDERQAIYGFKGCSDEFLRMCHADVSFTTYYLNQNYRCAPNILAFADSYLNTMEKISLKSEAVKTKSGIVEEDSTLLDAIEELEWTGDYQNWAIICRTNNELAAAVDFLDKRKIPNLSFKKGDLDLVEMEGLLRENKVKVLTIHTAKGLEFKKVIVIGAKTFNEEERKISYVAATRAEQALYCCPSICRRGKKGRPQNRDIADAGKIMQQMAKNNIVFKVRRVGNHLIYQDNDIKVEILGEFHNLIKKIGIPSNRLSEVQFKILLKCIFNLLEEKNFPVRNKKFISCSRVPIIQKGKIIEMSEMFSDFKFAFQVLSREGKWTPEIKDFIDEHYAADKVIFDSYFFDEPVYTVSGYFAMIKENNLLITLFTLDENIEDSD